MVAAVTAAATLLGQVVDGVPPLAVCLVAGLALGQLPGLARTAQGGLLLGRGLLLRTGVALLGFRLALGSIVAVGAGPVIAVVLVAAVTFVSVRLLSRRLGSGAILGALVGAGFAICGASAVVAVAGVLDADDDEVAFATGAATVCGTLSLLLLPLATARLGLSDEALGLWAGASVNDVGQAVATASVAGPAGLEVGVVTKLARVSLLAPLLVLLGVVSRRRQSDERVGGDGSSPVLPWFVVAFLLAAAVRTTGLVPAPVVTGARFLDVAFLGAGLVGVGAGVDLGAVRRGGWRPVVLAVSAWIIVVGAGLAAVTVVAGG